MKANETKIKEFNQLASLNQKQLIVISIFEKQKDQGNYSCSEKELFRKSKALHPTKKIFMEVIMDLLEEDIIKLETVNGKNSYQISNFDNLKKIFRHKSVEKSKRIYFSRKFQGTLETCQENHEKMIFQKLMDSLDKKGGILSKEDRPSKDYQELRKDMSFLTDDYFSFLMSELQRKNLIIMITNLSRITTCYLTSIGLKHYFNLRKKESITK